MARPPVDPRLWRYARSARNYLVLSVGLSLLTTVAIVAAAVLLGRVLAGVITDPGQRSVGAWHTELALLASAIAVRVLAAWWQARIAHRAGARVVAELEQSVLAAGAGLPPRELETRRTELAVVVSSGLGGLRPYLAGYVPALLLAVVVPPVVLVVIAAHDLTSAVIVIITLPLIPIFMVLIGLLTEGRARATLDATTRLSDQLLDLFAGMPTLRALGRETGTATETPGRTMSRQVRELGESLHRRTMSALRIAFLSSMVLELLATLSVALVAVAIGMRLVHGDMSLYAGVVALVLAPEVYLPLRTVGERFHAAQDGMAAADKAFAILDPAGAQDGDRSDPVRDREEPAAVDSPERAGAGTGGGRERGPAAGGECAPAGAGGRAGAESSWGVADRREAGDGAAANGGGPGPRQASAAVHAAISEKSTAGAGAPGRATGGGRGVIELRDLTVESRDGAAPDGLWAQLHPGAVTALTGPNGSGKSTVLQAILGLIEPTRGAVFAGGVDIRQLPAEQWWQRLAWLPQRPVLVPGTLRENLELLGATVSGSPRRGATRVLSELDAACATTGFDTVLESLPAGWDTVVGSGGVGLSLGQRQRLALTRVLAAGRPIVLLDEPTAHLDPDSESAVAGALTTLARTGATVVVVAHRPALLSAADEIVTVPSTAQRVAR
ncbi:ABC transporter ATP-binding protein/permease [Nocardia flavorosea]|uniref:ATP-binding cassette domain-containing protein n=1 Tax=Nocardia flavorosea TaxID=53429 RepID=A0A846YDK4_9NOCA|nr:ATP-binding cassette domain-containing protein [Nocardia flavorosea]NKY55814.1 ATP-binding cassette domain-containing protein [Nocardia flavorosea]